MSVVMKIRYDSLIFIIMIQFLIIILTIASIQHPSSALTTKKHHFLEIADTLRSNIREFFLSDEELFSSHSFYEEELFHSNHKNYDKTHPFIIKLSPKLCDVDKSSCHQVLKQYFGIKNHQYLGSKYGLITTSPSNFLEFESKHPELLLFRIPLQSKLKVDSNIRYLSKLSSKELCNKKLYEATSGFQNSQKKSTRLPKGHENKPVPPLRLRIVLSPLLKNEVEEFLNIAKSIEETYHDEIQVSYSNNQKSFNDVHYMIVTLKECALAETIADIFAELPEVQWIERSFNAYTHNRWIKGLCDTGDHDNTPLTNGNFTGRGQVVGVVDTGIDMKNCYFSDSTTNDVNYVELDDASTTSADYSQRKVIQYIPFADRIEDDDGHGTHVAGIAAGITEENYGDFKRYAGAAFDAKISFFDIGLENSTLNEDLVFPDNINSQLFVPLYESGAFVITNSWGTSSNRYDRLALRTDQFMHENPDALVIYSQGNSGDNGAGSMGSPATCKNCLSVGASLNDNEAWRAYEGDDPSIYGKDAVASFSSQGPTSDGRLKPDVLAPGWWVTSALGELNSKNDFCDIQALKGTSMSAPAAAAHALMLRQYFLNGYYPNGDADPADGFTPSGALLKAMLIHSGKPMTHLVQNSNNDISTISDSDYPSNIQGYGRIQMERVLHFDDADTDPINLFVVGAATSDAGTTLYQEIEDINDEDLHSFIAGGHSIRVTFAYTDQEGSSSVNGDIEVNQINIRVISDSGDQFLPYTVDNVNSFGSNVQMIDIENPDKGETYTVVVYPLDLPAGAQPYALVVTGDTEYLSDSINDDDDPEEGDNESLQVDGDALPYIIVLGFLVIFLAFLVWFFRRISKQKSSIMLDPRNFEVTDGFYNENTQDTGMGGRKSIFAKIRNIRAKQKAEDENASPEEIQKRRQEEADMRAARELQARLDRGEG